MISKTALLFLTILITTSNLVLAANFSVKIEPPSPKLNVPFNLIFTIKSDAEIEPYISFSPGTALVIGRKKRSKVLPPKTFNGKIHVQKEWEYRYELIKEKPGTLVIKNISIDINKKENPLENIKIEFIKEVKINKDLFLVSIPSKTRAFVGEALQLKYYLYYRVNIPVPEEVRVFPKLNGFIKRFHHVKKKIEMVEFNGEIYKREVKYHATIFPEQPGVGVIDPLKLTIKYLSRKSSRLRTVRYKSKRVDSPKVNIEILPLPTQNVPANFSGLVGEHTFVLSMDKNRYTTNEPIELKFEATGPGALEKFVAPQIYGHENLEDFETKSEIKDILNVANVHPRKIFFYTYLARSPLLIKKRTLSLSYFDPKTSSYKEKTLTLPSLTVFASSNFLKKNNSPATIKKIKRSLVAPLFFESKHTLLSIWPYVNYLLGFIFFIFILEYFIRSRKKTISSKDIATLCGKFKKGEFNYSSVFKLLNNLRSDFNSTNFALADLVDNSNLSNDSKKYFNSLAQSVEKSEFRGKNKSAKFRYKKKYFQELIRVINIIRNDSCTKS